MARKILLVDYNWTFYRSVYGFPNFMVDIDGKTFPTGGMFGIFQLVKSVLSSYKDIEIAFCMDGMPKRQETFAGYKASREPNQVIINAKRTNPDIIYLLSQIPQVRFLKNDEMEADDLIAMMAIRLKEKASIVVFSGDKDMIQLARYPQVHISNDIKNKQLQICSDDALFLKFEMKPKYLPYFRALRGDPSDEIPGAVSNVKIDIIRKFALLLHDNNNDWDKSYELLKECTKITEKTEAKILVGKENYFRNYDLMNLIKYEDPANWFPVTVVKTQSRYNDLELLDVYKMEQFKDFYMHHMRGKIFSNV
jgi:DNA polymerase-1